MTALLKGSKERTPASKDMARSPSSARQCNNLPRPNCNSVAALADLDVLEIPPGYVSHHDLHHKNLRLDTPTFHFDKALSSKLNYSTHNTSSS
jgi:hypothetical protein